MTRSSRTSLRLGLTATAVVAVASVSPSIGTASEGDADVVETPAPRVDFDLEIRPVLSRACFECHGPDAAARQADLRLDTEDGLLGDLGVVVPGDADASDLFARITHASPNRVMPPPDARHQLSPNEIALIRRWIEQGAAWKGHWSFTPPNRHPMPAVSRPDWSRDPIDGWILARLDAAGLVPSRDADKATLLRRVTFDLTGLPPAPEEIDAFLTDDAPDAYDRVVDRLLASPAFGERMATPWLDLARYADTYGYQSDVDRPVWPYRDWVIRAYNDNLPHDDFLRWQLAGDLLPDATRDQRLATAFNRLHRMTNEGGSVEEEYRVEYVSDRVHTMGTAMLGLTTECARCHDHKFDPISQREYYGLFAFFDDIEESGLYSHFTSATPTPSLLLTTPELDARIDAARARVAECEASLAATERAAAGRLAAWLATNPDTTTLPDLVVHLPMDGFLDGGRLANLANADQPATTEESPVLCDGADDGGLRLSGENALRVPGAEFSRFDPFTIALRLKVPAITERTVVMHRSKAWTDAGSQGWELLLEDGVPRFSLIHFWPGDAISIRGTALLPVNEWLDVAVVSDGSSRADGLAIFVNGERVETKTTHDHLVKAITGGGPGPMTIGQRFRDRGFKNGEIDDLRVVARACSPAEIRHLFDGRPLIDPANESDATDAYAAAFDPEVRTARSTLRDARRELAAALDATPEIMTMSESATPRVARVLARGRYDLPGDVVEPGTPAILPLLADATPRTRLGLADWMLDPNHPLTARVAVNRLWMVAFGTGLVATPEDFGVQGLRPSHPELLDELALDFIASGWDVKAMLRRLVRTATYRQSSIADAAARERDPENRLHSHAPARRLSGEMLRDQAVAAGGLLVGTIGGPSVFPYEPAGLWEEKSGRRYPTSSGDALHRRSLYTFWKRTSPPPAMLTLDAAKRDVCLARRSETATPLQALVMLNDPQFVEAARVLAERVLAEQVSRDDAIATAFVRLTGRPPTAEEATILRDIHAAELAAFTADVAAAAKVAATGAHPRTDGLADAEVAAMTIVASAIMNTDAASTRR